MTIDERIAALTSNQEEINAALQQDGEHIRQLAVIVREMADSIKRLERIATAHSFDIDDIQERLNEIEGRRQKKPQ